MGFKHGIFVDCDGGLGEAIAASLTQPSQWPPSTQLHLFYRRSNSALHEQLNTLQALLNSKEAARVQLHPSGPASLSLPNAADVRLLIQASAAVATRKHKKSVWLVYRQDRWFEEAASALKQVAADAAMGNTSIKIRLCAIPEAAEEAVRRFQQEVLAMISPALAKASKSKQTIALTASCSQASSPLTSSFSAAATEKFLRCSTASCSKEFSSEVALKQHIKMKHSQLGQAALASAASASNNKPFSCSICSGRRFQTSSGLAQHMKDKHPKMSMLAPAAGALPASAPNGSSPPQASLAVPASTISASSSHNSSSSADASSSIGQQSSFPLHRWYGSGRPKVEYNAPYCYRCNNMLNHCDC